MVMFKALEHAFCHYILKICWWLVSRDPASMSQHEAKVATLPGNRLTVTDQTCRHSRHRSFSRPRGALHMQVNTEREQKTSPRRSRNPRLKLDRLHCYSPGLFCSTSAFARARNSSSPTLPSSPLPLVRTLTASEAASLSPITSTNGTFCSVNSRIFAFIFSFRASSSTR